MILSLFIVWGEDVERVLPPREVSEGVRSVGW